MTDKALRCDYCGGYINPKTYQCEYCGTQYVKPRIEGYSPMELKVVSVPAPVETLKVGMRVPFDRAMKMQEMGMPVEEYVRRDFAEQIAEHIAKDIEIYEDFDIRGYEKTYTARLRVVKPDFRF